MSDGENDDEMSDVDNDISLLQATICGSAQQRLEPQPSPQPQIATPRGRPRAAARRTVIGNGTTHTMVGGSSEAGDSGDMRADVALMVAEADSGALLPHCRLPDGRGAVV